MRDFQPSEAEKLRYIEKRTREIARLYGFGEIITPVVEYHDLLAKSGEEIKSRMYTFKDLGERKVSLRPEFTASVARLVATTLRNEPKPLRLFSTGTLYRYDEPQFGRYREFWQSNYEVIGSDKPQSDVEVLSLTNDLMQKLGLRNCRLKIGHVGVLRGLLSHEGLEAEQQNAVMQLLDSKRWDEAVSAAKKYHITQKGKAALKKVLNAKGEDVSKVLVQMSKELKEYPSSVNAIQNLTQIIELCKESTVKFKVHVEMGFARGLEYYTGMIFEVLVPEMEISLGGGGRYDKLIETFGGEPTPAVGVAHGLDRIALAMDKQNVTQKSTKKIVAAIPIGRDAVPKIMELALKLRKKGVAVELEVMGRSASRALQDANRRNATHAAIIGPKELKDGKVMLRDMKSRQQRRVNLEEMLDALSVADD